MNSYQLEYSFNKEDIEKKQENWRNKQFKIFYGSGRPIFNIDTETEHLRYHRDPYFVKDFNKYSTGKNFVPLYKPPIHNDSE
tara:strand:- start:346 stop:591 length:246 start_codon:yes stop_codon:yes gene_type:complete